MSTVDEVARLTDAETQARTAAHEIRVREDENRQLQQIRNYAAAKMKAAGVRNAEIARVTGLSAARVGQLDLSNVEPPAVAAPAG